MDSLAQVPDEIIRHILLYISPEINLTRLHRVSKRLENLASEPLLWRHHCCVDYKYWAEEHNFAQRLANKATDTDWRALWIVRKQADLRCARLLNELLTTKVGRLEKLGMICELGYDAKDFLLKQCRADNSLEDVLARRYYAHTALGSIHRSLAVREWCLFQSSQLTIDGLDRALGAFDMFVLHEKGQDMDAIQRSLDDFANQFRRETENFVDMTTRQKALALVRWVRAQNLTGMEDPVKNYRNLRNCLIGQALVDPDHPSLPIVSSAIFCCIARRLDIDAWCCAFPTHVHTAVFAAPGKTLDGKVCLQPNDSNAKMLLDPYGSDGEVHVSELRIKLVELGWNSGNTSDIFLSPSPISIIVQRTAQNIRASWTRARELHDSMIDSTELRRLSSGDPDLNLEAMLYSAMWAGLLLTPTSSGHWDELLEGFLSRFVQNFSEDAWIVRRWLMPLYNTFVQTHPRGNFRFGWQDAKAMLGVVHNQDMREPTVSRRYTQEICAKVRFRIGQVFKHKRYGYVAIINGWASDGPKGLPTPHNMSTDEAVDSSESDGESLVPMHRRQTFYTCLMTGVDRHVVAQDNVQIITDPDAIPETLFFLAGKFFKRFDRKTCTFVSNIREFFPDD